MPEFTYRLFQWDDISELVDVFNQIIIADEEETPLLTSEELHRQLETPGFDPLNNVYSAYAPDGRLAGNIFIRMMPDSGQGTSNLLVHPDFRWMGLEECLLDWSEKRILQRAADLPETTPVFAQRYITDKKTRLINLVEAQGYKAVRHFYTMRIDLNTPVEAPEFPAGITLRPVEWERDAHAIHAAEEEAFQDHWGHFNMPYANWEHYFHGPDMDITLWQIAMDGDEIAGISLNHVWDAKKPDLAWIAVLGVRKPWRKHGLGAALLRQSFHVFQQRGFTQAGLNVDATNTTNAVALYERVGMHVHNRRIAYRKVLRGREEDIQD
jgi:mycothiol synthase